MKHSLKDYSLALSEKDYHAYPAWSYSLIARYAREGFSSVATLHDQVEPTSSMEFGSLFDSILTRGRKTLDDYVVDETVAPPAETKVYDWLLSHGHTESFDQISASDITTAVEACKFYPNLNPATRQAKLDKSSSYYNIRRTGKKLVSKKDWDDAMDMARVFRHDPYLKKLFGTKNTDEIEYIYQAQFKTTFNTGFEAIDLKIMPDLMVVNHKEKTIRLVDLKTSSMPAYDFAENFLKYRYDIQGELYTDVIKMIIAEDEQYRDYTVLPYLFTDISRTDKVPATYEIDLSNGFSYTKGDKVYTYKGWKELLAEILVYEANEAKVPSYIKTDGPNDLISILSR